MVSGGGPAELMFHPLALTSTLLIGSAESERGKRNEEQSIISVRTLDETEVRTRQFRQARRN